MGKLVLFSLSISIACMIAIVDANFFGDYDSIGSSGSHYQSIGDGYAPHRSNFDAFGGDGPLQNVHMGGFGRIGGSSHRLSRPRGSGGGSGSGRGGRGGTGDKGKRSKGSNKKKEETDSSGMDSSEGNVIQFSDLVKNKKGEHAKYEERFQNIHGVSLQQFHLLKEEVRAGLSTVQGKDFTAKKLAEHEKKPKQGKKPKDGKNAKEGKESETKKDEEETTE